jgi:hypothetical protein
VVDLYEPECATRCCSQIDYQQDVGDTLDYDFNWVVKLGEDTIVMSDFTLPDGLTEVSSSNNTHSATIFVSGGTAGRVYRIVNTITTAGGRTHERTIRVQITDC